MSYMSTYQNDEPCKIVVSNSNIYNKFISNQKYIIFKNYLNKSHNFSIYTDIYNMKQILNRIKFQLLTDILYHTNDNLQYNQLNNKRNNIISTIKGPFNSSILLHNNIIVDIHNIDKIFMFSDSTIEFNLINKYKKNKFIIYKCFVKHLPYIPIYNYIILNDDDTFSDIINRIENDLFYSYNIKNSKVINIGYFPSKYEELNIILSYSHMEPELLNQLLQTKFCEYILINDNKYYIPYFYME